MLLLQCLFGLIIIIKKNVSAPPSETSSAKVDVEREVEVDNGISEF